METNVRTILEGLNDEQRKAVCQTSGPVLIVAGAGSGKTRVLTSRIAYLLDSGVKASNILALTFTKKAAGEMKERISLMVGARTARHLVMGTFHAVFVRFLREYAESLGYKSDFTIYDTSDSQSAIKACVKELGLDEKVYKPRAVLSRISMAKNNLVTVGSYLNDTTIATQDRAAKLPYIGRIYDLYQKKMKSSSVMDFDDILVNMNILLRDNAEAREAIAMRFSHIMVDEYQDTNMAQYKIIMRLSEKHRNLCVVGDDSQSIYAFRGARIENILRFEKDYPEYKIFRLERNYRSTRNIVSAANSVIAKNSNRIPKECYSEGETGEKIRIVHCYTELEEANMLVSMIQERIRSDHARYSDFAILYRTNSQSRAIEESLRRRNIPYIIYSGNSFFERAEVKSMMAYFKLAVNPDDDESMRRVINLPARGIGGTTMEALTSFAAAQGISLYRAAMHPGILQSGIKQAIIEKIRAFCAMIEGFSGLCASMDADELTRKIAEDSGLYNYYALDLSIEGQARRANVDELLDSVVSFVEEQTSEASEDEISDGGVVTLSDYLENVSLLSNVDVDEGDENNKVALMTVHSAKGLEFPYVMIAGLEENLFPGSSARENPCELEEERRLFYVAITRAKIAVALCFADSRMRNGSKQYNSPSRFIKEIDPKYIENPMGGSPVASPVLRPSQRPLFGTQPGKSPVRRTAAPGAKPDIIDENFVAVPMTELYEGEKVEHNRFGAGVIKSISGQVPDLRATVVFDNYGEKLLLLKFAKLRPLKK
ncbi:MAG: UvrD-helicase domain-containing protein [Bacteroidales bacterium]|nr:UvrD-helicase domain-containing protein [Bacteroidales bacterium]